MKIENKWCKEKRPTIDQTGHFSWQPVNRASVSPLGTNWAGNIKRKQLWIRRSQEKFFFKASSTFFINYDIGDVWTWRWRLPHSYCCMRLKSRHWGNRGYSGHRTPWKRQGGGGGRKGEYLAGIRYSDICWVNIDQIFKYLGGIRAQKQNCRYTIFVGFHWQRIFVLIRNIKVAPQFQTLDEEKGGRKVKEVIHEC